MTTPKKCARCGEVHVASKGRRGCAGHSKKTGKPCRKAPVIGAEVCTSHGGAAKQVRAAAARRREAQAAKEAVATLGLPVDISPTEALLEEVRWTAGHVYWLRRKVQELDEAAGLVNEHGDQIINPGERHALTWGTTKVKTGGEDSGTTQEAKPSIWYALYENERKHLVVVCTAALRAGVEERRVRLAEQQGDLVATAIRRILDALNLTPAQQQLVGQVVPRELRAIAGGAA